MGGAHSRARPGIGPAKIRSTKLGASGRHAAELAAAAACDKRGQGRAHGRAGDGTVTF